MLQGEAKIFQQEGMMHVWATLTGDYKGQLEVRLPVPVQLVSQRAVSTVMGGTRIGHTCDSE